MKTKALTLILFVFGIAALLILSGMAVNSCADMINTAFTERAELQTENIILKDKLDEAEEIIHSYEKALAFFSGADELDGYRVDVQIVPEEEGWE